MKTLNTASVVLTIAAFLPALGHASIENRSASACAHAFAASMAGTAGETPSYKFAYYSDQATSLTADYYATRYVFELQARDPKTGSEIGRASCTTSKSGKIIALTTLPLASPAKFASR